MCFPQPDRDTEWWRAQRSNSQTTNKKNMLFYIRFECCLRPFYCHRRRRRRHCPPCDIRLRFFFSLSLRWSVQCEQCNSMHVDIKWIRFYLIQLYIDICICCWNSRTSWTWKQSSMFDFFFSLCLFFVSFEGNDFLFTSLLDRANWKRIVSCVSRALRSQKHTAINSKNAAFNSKQCIAFRSHLSSMNV